EAAESHRVEEHEPPRVLVLEHRQVFGEALGRRRVGCVLGHEAKGNEHDHSGISASPNTLCQPKAIASPGANNAANAVPELPAPAMPIAVPWCSGGYQREASGKAAANDAPATPRNTPSISNSLNECTPATQA